ncbi:MAG TPA: hypothetical protein VG900_01335 [Hyphomicrobiaceae bacterium]|jgi:hypothetical protein|nr:hypothetical protein [Hyphomicrobiaceae bacterium]
MGLWSVVREEIREIVWLASVIWGLSVIGVGLAVMLAIVMNDGFSPLAAAAYDHVQAIL